MSKTRIVGVNDNGKIHYEIEERVFWFGWQGYGYGDYQVNKYDTYEEAVEVCKQIESSFYTKKVIKS